MRVPIFCYRREKQSASARSTSCPFCLTQLRVLFRKLTERVDRYKPSAPGPDGSDAAGIKKLLHERAADSKLASRFLNTNEKCLPVATEVRGGVFVPVMYHLQPTMPVQRKCVKKTVAEESVSNISRFATWLDDVMKGYSIANSSLSRHLGGENVAPSPRIRSWRKGTWKRPRPDTCFRVGEALRSAGVPWSNGALALLTAGHLAEFVSLLLVLSEASVEAGFVAMVLFSMCATITIPIVETPGENLVDEARDWLESLLQHYGEDIAAVWRDTPRSAILRRDVSGEARSPLGIALIMAQSLPVEDELLEIEVHNALLRWTGLYEALTPGFEAFTKRFLKALRDGLAERESSYRNKKLSWRGFDLSVEAWDRVWLHLMNETEDYD